MTFTKATQSSEETLEIAKSLAPNLTAGDTVLLSGDVGAGKTDLTRKIIQDCMQAAGFIEDIPSPTFTLVQTYEVGDLEFVHADIYRITDIDEIYELGLERAFETAVCFVEWPQKLGNLAPRDALNVDIEIGNQDHRNFTFSWTHAKWHDKLKTLNSLNLGDQK